MSDVKDNYGATYNTSEHGATNVWSALDRAAQREFPRDDASVAEIWAYADRYSYLPGDEVRLFVHTTAPRYAITVYRDGARRTVVYSEKNLAGVRQTTAEDAFATGCGWRDTATIPTGKDWRSGVYVIILQTLGMSGDSIEREAFFVLRSPSPGRDTSIVFVLSTATYTAYNDWGGANHYRRIEQGRPTDNPAPELSLQRPMARGFIRLPKGAPRYTDTPRLLPGGMPRYPWLEWAFAYDYSRHYCDSGWATYDGPFVRWAETEGYRLDFLTQYDLHADPGCLEPYGVAIIVGHDEYWSWQMRDAVDGFVDGGGNVARFAGNFFWQIRLEDGGRTQVCYKVASADPMSKSPDKHLTTTSWDTRIVGRLCTETLGLTGFGGVYSRFGNAAPRASGGLTVYRPDHWVFEETDLYYGDQFGAAPSHIVSFEVDGVDYGFRGGLPYPTGKDGAPESLSILAMAPTAGIFESNRHGHIVNAPQDEVTPVFESAPWAYEITGDDLAHGAAMMAVFDRGKGTVFNVGCSEWVSGLIERDYFVEQVTRNVMNRLKG